MTPSAGLQRSVATRGRISMRAVRPVAEALRALGTSPETVLDRAGIPAALLARHDARVPHDAVMAFWRHARDAVGDPVGLRLASATPLSSLGLHAYVALSADSIASAFRAAARLQRLLHDVTRLSLRTDADALHVTHGFPGGEPLPQPVAEYLAALWLRFARELQPGDWRLTGVTFAHHALPGALPEYLAHFGPAVSFRTATTTLSIPREVAFAPSRQANAGLNAVLGEYAELLLQVAPSSDSTADTVRASVLDALHHHRVPSLALVARELCHSTRSLHRHLEREGTTFSEIVDRSRHELACRLLRAERPSVGDVAFLAGFAELSAFYRAFRRWTGTTPVDYRRQALARVADVGSAATGSSSGVSSARHARPRGLTA